MNEERKWIRLQKAGLLMLLAIPVTIAVVGTVFGFTITGPRAISIFNPLALAIAALAMAGGVCFIYGDQQRVGLRKKNNNAQNTHSGQ